MNIGIDLGGSHIGVGLVDLNGKIVAKKDTDIHMKDAINIENFIIKTIVSDIKELLEFNKNTLKDIDVIGIGTPGEPENGIIKRIVNLGIKDFPIVQKLQKELNYNNIIIKNDGKCAAIAEKKYGSMKEFEDCVFLCLGTGIGGASFLDSKLLKPKKHSGFEIGHMIIEKDGNLCKCGNRGCFETYCSMKRLKEKINREINKEHMESRDLLIFLKENSENEKIKEIIKEYIENLNIGLSNIINLLEPQCITLGGGFVHFKDILWNDLELEFKKAKYLFNKEDIPVIKLAELGNDAGIIGASIDINKK